MQEGREKVCKIVVEMIYGEAQLGGAEREGESGELKESFVWQAFISS